MRFVIVSKRHCFSLTPADHIVAAVSLKNVEFSHRASAGMDEKTCDPTQTPITY